MRHLPALSDGQCWCCSRGCGACATKPILFEHSREEHQNGDVESKAHRVYVSACCSTDLLLWDAEKQDFLDWCYVEVECGRDLVTVDQAVDFLGTDLRHRPPARMRESVPLAQPEFRLPASVNIHALIDACRIAVEANPYLQEHIDTFDHFMACEICKGQGTVIEQSDDGSDMPDALSSQYVLCPSCHPVSG